MGDENAKEVTRTLLDEHGPAETWQHATREAIDAHLRGDAAAAAHWAAIQQELRAIAPRPGAGDLDIYRAARTLVAYYGAQEAWRHAMQQSVEAEGDLLGQAYWLRVADAVNALARGHGKQGA